MKPESPDANQRRFQAQLRHYHRINTQEPMSWDEWIHGQARNRRRNLRRALVISAWALGVLALAGLAAALFIELG